MLRLVGLKSAQPFTDPELDKIEEHWRELLAMYQIAVKEIKKVAVKKIDEETNKELKWRALSIELADSSHLQIDHRGITFTGAVNENDDAIRASLVFFKKKWRGKAAALEGTDRFKLKTWVQAQLLGVEIKGWEPSEEQLKELKNTISIHIDLADPERRQMEAWTAAKLWETPPKPRGRVAKLWGIAAKLWSYTPTPEHLAATRVYVHPSPQRQDPVARMVRRREAVAA